MKFRTLLSGVMLWLAGTASAEDVGGQLESRLNAAKTLKAQFTQVVRADRREISRSKGTMALQRPGKFRWSVAAPMEQLVIADGENLWIYDIDLEQVTVKKQGKSIGGTPALFLSGATQQITNDFEVSMHAEKDKEYYELRARSPQENFQKINMVFRKDSLSRLILHDQLGQVTSIDFRKVQANRPLSEKLFRFVPPRGVDVVRQ